MVWASGQDASLVRCFGHVLSVGDLVADPGPAGETTSLSWLGNDSVSP